MNARGILNGQSGLTVLDIRRVLQQVTKQLQDTRIEMLSG